MCIYFYFDLFFRSLLAIDIETRSRLNVLSDSIMRHPALNDVTEDSDFEHEHGKL